jgi:hypothetical protein
MTMNSPSTPSSSSDSLQNAVARPSPQAPGSSEPDPVSGCLPRPCVLTLESSLSTVSQSCKNARRRRQRTYPGSAEALSMLTLRPVFTAPVPRHHVEPRAADGALVVHDRATSDQFVVYSPRFVYQFRAGHHAGLWYLRPATDVGVTPRSAGFRTAQAAIEALRDGGWRLPGAKTPGHHRANNCRIRWS